jgi:hypothetical protein
LDGSEIAGGSFGSVRSEPLRILAAQIPNRWSSEYSRSTGGWVIVFNDDVDPAAVSGFL